MWIACVVSDQPVHWGGSARIVLFPAGDDGREPQALAVTPDAQCTPIGWSTHQRMTAGLKEYIGKQLCQIT